MNILQTQGDGSQHKWCLFQTIEQSNRNFIPCMPYLPVYQASGVFFSWGSVLEGNGKHWTNHKVLQWIINCQFTAHSLSGPSLSHHGWLSFKGWILKGGPAFQSFYNSGEDIFQFFLSACNCVHCKWTYCKLKGMVTNTSSLSWKQ